MAHRWVVVTRCGQQKEGPLPPRHNEEGRMGQEVGVGRGLLPLGPKPEAGVYLVSGAGNRQKGMG